MKKIFLITIAVSLMLTAQAQTKTTTTTTTTEKTEELGPNDTIQRYGHATNTPAHHPDKNYGLFLIYSPIDLLIPGKVGGSFYFSSEDRMNQYEISYLRASLSINQTIGDANVASMTEQKITFLNRHLSNHSGFNWFYGLSYATLESRLGKEYINSLPPGTTHDPDLLQVDVLALDIGFGNRWYFDSGITLGVDWLGVTQPLATLKKKESFTDQTSSQSDKDDVEKFINIMTSFPRLYTLKVQLGYSF